MRNIRIPEFHTPKTALAGRIPLGKEAWDSDTEASVRQVAPNFPFGWSHLHRYSQLKLLRVTLFFAA
jgi:hypothetical protein